MTKLTLTTLLASLTLACVPAGDEAGDETPIDDLPQLRTLGPEAYFDDTLEDER